MRGTPSPLPSQVLSKLQQDIRDACRKGSFHQTRRELCRRQRVQDRHRIVVGSSPGERGKVTKDLLCLWVPGPPKIPTHLPELLGHGFGAFDLVEILNFFLSTQFRVSLSEIARPHLTEKLGRSQRTSR